MAFKGASPLAPVEGAIRMAPLGDPRGTQGNPGARNLLGTVDGINLATPKGFYSKSRKSKNSNKNQKLYTIVHLPAQTRRDIEKNHTNFASRIRQNPL